MAGCDPFSDRQHATLSGQPASRKSDSVPAHLRAAQRPIKSSRG